MFRLLPKDWRKTLLFGLMLTAAMALSTPSHAIPVLQLYIEGSTYEPTTQSWTLNQWSFSTNGPIRIWTIGNVAGPGGKGVISDVRLSIAYDAGLSPVITLTPSTTAGYMGFFDPSTPRTPVFNQTGANGSAPLLSDGTPLPSHGEFGPGIEWQEFRLGLFDKADSPIGEFINSFPTALSTQGAGQINVYELSAANIPTGVLSLHFDLYGSVRAEGTTDHLRRAIFAPFSHDADASVVSSPASSGVPVAEPRLGSLVGLGSLLLAGAACRMRRKP